MAAPVKTPGRKFERNARRSVWREYDPAHNAKPASFDESIPA
jgi:hypothetical protein